MGIAAKMIRRLDGCQQYGWNRPWSEWAGTLSICRGDGTDYCSFQYSWHMDWYLRDPQTMGRPEFRDLLQQGVWQKMVAVAKRYTRFRRYMTEVRHQWVVVQTYCFADNSEEVEEKSTLTGETRRRMTVAPHGDVC